MKLIPLQDRVIVKRMRAAETELESGIVLPGTATERADQGEVLAVGPGKRDASGDFVQPAVRVGDRVLFAKYSGQLVRLDDSTELLVMREEDVLAVVEER
jgi:chaperonin GroES